MKEEGLKEGKVIQDQLEDLERREESRVGGKGSSWLKRGRVWEAGKRKARQSHFRKGG